MSNSNRQNRSRNQQLESIDEQLTNKLNSSNAADDNFSSVSNNSNEILSFISNTSSSLINFKNKNLNSNSAYFASLKIKKDYNLIQKIDLSENYLEDEGIIYVSIALKMCTYLETLVLCNISMTEYGLRILIENVNNSCLKYLDISGNSIGNKGVEHVSKFLPTSYIEYLNISSNGIEDEGGKVLGITLSGNNCLKVLELARNNIKNNGAVLLCRGLTANYRVEEINLAHNSFGPEGAVAVADVIKYNRNLKFIDLRNNRFNFESAKFFSAALKTNNSLKSLILDGNNLTTSGAFEIIIALNNDTSKLEYLSIKNIPILKHLLLIIEIIQQRRKFKCEHGPVVIFPDNANFRLSAQDDSMIKLAKYLSEKKMKLIDMFKILDNQKTFSLDKNEFVKRMKAFEPRLTHKDVLTIADNLSNKNTIYYSSLFNQITRQKDLSLNSGDSASAPTTQFAGQEFFLLNNIQEEEEEEKKIKNDYKNNEIALTTSSSTSSYSPPQKNPSFKLASINNSKNFNLSKSDSEIDDKQKNYVRYWIQNTTEANSNSAFKLPKVNLKNNSNAESTPRVLGQKRSPSAIRLNETSTSRKFRSESMLARTSKTDDEMRMLMLDDAQMERNSKIKKTQQLLRNNEEKNTKIPKLKYEMKKNNEVNVSNKQNYLSTNLLVKQSTTRKQIKLDQSEINDDFQENLEKSPENKEKNEPNKVTASKTSD